MATGTDTQKSKFEGLHYACIERHCACRAELRSLVQPAQRLAQCSPNAVIFHLPWEMDPISLTASIIAILQLTTELIKVTRNVYKDIKNAPKEVDELLNEFTSFSAVLEHLKAIIEEAEADKRFEAARNGLYGISKTGSRLPTIQEQMKPNGPLATCQREMAAFKTRFDIDTSRVKRALRWPFEKGEVVALIGRLRNMKSNLDTAIATDKV